MTPDNPRQAQKIDPETAQRFAQLRREGASDRRIARETGRSARAVARVLDRLTGPPSGPRAEQNSAVRSAAAMKAAKLLVGRRRLCPPGITSEAGTVEWFAENELSWLDGLWRAARAAGLVRLPHPNQITRFNIESLNGDRDHE